MKLQPAQDRVIVRPDKVERKGVKLPNADAELFPVRMGVIDSMLIKDPQANMEIGATVVFTEWESKRLWIEGVEYLILETADIHAILRD